MKQSRTLHLLSNHSNVHTTSSQPSALFQIQFCYDPLDVTSIAASGRHRRDRVVYHEIKVMPRTCNQTIINRRFTKTMTPQKVDIYCTRATEKKKRLAWSVHERSFIVRNPNLYNQSGDFFLVVSLGQQNSDPPTYILSTSSVVSTTTQRLHVDVCEFLAFSSSPETCPTRNQRAFHVHLNLLFHCPHPNRLFPSKMIQIFVVIQVFALTGFGSRPIPCNASTQTRTASLVSFYLPNVKPFPL